MVHSSLRRTCQRTGLSPVEILELMIEAVGDKGTLLFPTFNFGWCNGEPYDVRFTTSKMGALSEAARNYPTTLRTQHPIYSFAVIGKCADEFVELSNVCGTGPGSPFDLLVRMDGKIASIDLIENDTNTIHHHAEHMVGVNYRFIKTWPGSYVTWEGDVIEREYSLLVRDLDMGVVTWVNPMGGRFWDKGLFHGDHPWEGDGMRIIRAVSFMRAVKEVVESGLAHRYLYRIKKK